MVTFYNENKHSEKNGKLPWRTLTPVKSCVPAIKYGDLRLSFEPSRRDAVVA